MKILIFGLGSIGVRHAKILKKNKKYKLYAYRTHKGQTENSLNIEEVQSWKTIDRIKPDVAFITNPTSLHIQTAIKCAERGMHLFIEKPLDSRVVHLNEFLKLVSKKKITTYVAYCLRFHPVIKELRRQIQKDKFYHLRAIVSTYLHRWREGSDPKKSYSAQKRLGGGIILDLSHEIDYVQYLLGDIKSIKGRFDRKSTLTVDTEDNADMTIEAKKGTASVHMNYFSQFEQRVIQVDLKSKSFEGDLVKNTLTEYRNGKVFKKRKFKTGTKETYSEQIRYFFKNINNQNMMNNVFEAAELLKSIHSFKKAKNR